RASPLPQGNVGDFKINAVPVGAGLLAKGPAASQSIIMDCQARNIDAIKLQLLQHHAIKSLKPT
ncbi:MAG: hypothetical protein ACJ8HF_22895, partial [Pseudomonas sp.]